jgi:putative membrane protein
MRPFLTRWLCTTIAVAVAAHLTGMRYDNLGALVGAALLLGIVNALIRPVLLLLSLPFILLTLGLFILVINGLLLWLVGSIVPGFHVDTFGTAFFGALIVSVVSWLLSSFFRASDGRYHVITHHEALARTGEKRVTGRVIE